MGVEKGRGGENEIECRICMLENTVREQRAIIERQEKDILDLKKVIGGANTNNDFPRLPETRPPVLQARTQIGTARESEEENMMRKRRRLIDVSERTIYLKPITDEMLEIEENKILGEIKEKRESMDENGRLMLKEKALKNLVLDFFKTRLKISPENLPKIDMDKIFLPDNLKKSTFDKVYVEFPNVQIVGWIMSHVRNLERGGGGGS